MKSPQVICTRDLTKVLKESKRNISAEKRILYGKLGQYQKIREIIAGHLYQGLSPQSFLMFELVIFKILDLAMLLIY